MKLPRVALIAHDGKKQDLVDFVKAHFDWFSIGPLWRRARQVAESKPWDFQSIGWLRVRLGVMPKSRLESPMACWMR